MAFLYDISRLFERPLLEVDVARVEIREGHLLCRGLILLQRRIQLAPLLIRDPQIDVLLRAEGITQKGDPRDRAGAGEHGQERQAEGFKTSVQ